MAQQRAERLMNLHILLLGATRFVTKDVIRRACYGEHPATAAGDEAFERAFERDKDALRQIGAVIEVGSADAYFDDELGYRIPTEQTSLPEIRFESSRIEQVDGNRHKIVGELTIKEVPVVVELDAKFQGTGTDAEGVEKTLFRVEGAVEWGPTRVEITADITAIHQ